MTLKGLTDTGPMTLKFVNCVFYGLPIEGSSAQAEFKDGILSLTHVDMETVSGVPKEPSGSLPTGPPPMI